MLSQVPNLITRKRKIWFYLYLHVSILYSAQIFSDVILKTWSILIWRKNQAIYLSEMKLRCCWGVVQEEEGRSSEFWITLCSSWVRVWWTVLLLFVCFPREQNLFNVFRGFHVPTYFNSNRPEWPTPRHLMAKSQTISTFCFHFSSLWHTGPYMNFFF